MNTSQRRGDARWQLSGTTVIVPIGSLLAADSPRLTGENAEHVRLLAAVESPLPPILVHRSTGRVVDGMHRVAAALMCGETTIAVEYFDGSNAQAFIRAVQVNVQHGLPLARADREAAVRRVIASQPQWSNRMIAAVTGLSAPTVGKIRHRSTDHLAQPDARIGRDGRVRPMSSAKGRLWASELIRERPEASLREIARASGVSVGTVRDVRERLLRGDDPVPARCARATEAPRTQEVEDTTTPRSAAAAAALQHLRKDPSLRFTETGRALLQWLGVHVVGNADQEHFLSTIPDHCTGMVADLAWGCADIWKQLAEQLEQRRDRTA